MSKAEEIALSKYPVLKTELGDINYLPRISFIEGYRQAEKDNELTWEDLATIDQLLWDMSIEWSDKKDNEGYFKEVLKQFKERKEK